MRLVFMGQVISAGGDGTAKPRTVAGDFRRRDCRATALRRIPRLAAA